MRGDERRGEEKGKMDVLLMHTTNTVTTTSSKGGSRSTQDFKNR